MTRLQPETAREPAMALAAGADGLDFYRALAEHYQAALRPGGALVLEIGWQQREAVAALLAARGWPASPAGRTTPATTAASRPGGLWPGRERESGHNLLL